MANYEDDEVKLEVGHAVAIEYEKKNCDIVERFIVPVAIPKEYIRAIDVSGDDYDEVAVAEMEHYVTEYAQYVKDHMSSMFTFEDFVDHTFNESIEVQWKTFNIYGIWEVDDIIFMDDEDDEDSDEDSDEDWSDGEDDEDEDDESISWPWDKE